MTSKLVRFSMAVLCAFSLTAFAQTSLPAAPGSAPAPTAAPTTKVGTINIQEAISATNEGQRDLEALYKKLEPKQTELKAQNDELDSLRKQLQTQGDKLNDETRGNLVRQIDTKQKAFDRSMQDAREDVQTQQQEIMQRILQKMAPVMMKYVTDSGYGLLIDTSKQWPDGQAILGPGWAADITKPVVDAYNTQSGVPAPPPAPAGSRPAGARPSGAAKPAAPAAK
jgi:outer membrane protein